MSEGSNCSTFSLGNAHLHTGNKASVPSEKQPYTDWCSRNTVFFKCVCCDLSQIFVVVVADVPEKETDFTERIIAGPL